MLPHRWKIMGSLFAIQCRQERRRRWQPTSVLLPGKSHGQRSLVVCSPGGCGESDTTERLHFDFSLSCIGEGNGNPLQCSCLENPRDGGAWWAAVYGVAQSRTQLKRLSSSSSSSSRQEEIYSFYPMSNICWPNDKWKDKSTSPGGGNLWSVSGMCITKEHKKNAATAKSLLLLQALPTRLCHPWDSPGKNTGVGSHFLCYWALNPRVNKKKSRSMIIKFIIGM